MKMGFDYESMLDEAMGKIPKKDGTGKRFKVPQVVVESQGSRTAIKNFSEVCSALRREPQHVSKFIAKELAAPASIQNGTMVIQAKLSRDVLQRKVEDYIKSFVYCKVCGEPDTNLEREDRIFFMRCEACGARSTAKSI